MDYNMPSVCPVCSGGLDITKLTCPTCHSEITGKFRPCKYCALDEKMRVFLEVFLKSGGNIKEVERTLSMSYPTVKGLLNELIKTLFGEEPRKAAKKYTVEEVLDLLEGEAISVDEAANLLSGKDSGFDNSIRRDDNE
jgi:hypothetical protein